MKKAILSIAAVLTLLPSLSMAQGMAGVNPEAEDMQAKMNRDDYPYSVLRNGPILPPEERRKLRDYYIKIEQAAEAREANKIHQFRAMSADERRYVIETQGFPPEATPGYK